MDGVLLLIAIVKSGLCLVTARTRTRERVTRKEVCALCFA
jgi:cell division protein FtsL